MNNKKIIALYCAVAAVVFSLLFIVIRPVSSVFIISYIFALLGLALLYFTSAQVIDRKEQYPWTAALPKAARSYLIIQLLVSTVAVLLSETAKWSTASQEASAAIGALHIAPGWYLVIHCALLLIFTGRIALLFGGIRHISSKEADIKTKASFVKEKTAEAEFIVSKCTADDAKKAAVKVYEAIRFSDPVSSDALYACEEKISEKLAEFSAAISNNNLTLIDELAAELLGLISERNYKCKALK